jgi:2-methylcitrate dehydratase PrpD
VTELAGRVQMSSSEAYEQMRPVRNPAKVTLHLKDGEEVTGEVLNCLGDPLKPMPREALMRKFLDLAGSVLGKSKAEDFVAAFQNLESVKNVKPLLRLLRPEA